ncbi:hypothetical protein D3C76_1298010 [compost metagenome]
MNSIANFNVLGVFARANLRQDSISILRKNARIIAIPKFVINEENELRKPTTNCAPLVTHLDRNPVSVAK